MQQPVSCRKIIGVAGVDALPLVVSALLGGRQVEHGGEPGFAVGAVVGKGLAGPFAGDQDSSAGVAEVLGSVRLTLAQAGYQAGPGVLGLDAVPEPVRAHR
jgi:hypothetical protein